MTFVDLGTMLRNQRWLAALVCLGGAALVLDSCWRTPDFARLKTEEIFRKAPALAFVRAAELGDIDEMRRLTDQGFDVNYLGRGRMTPLIKVLLACQRESYEALLQMGADPNIEMVNGWSVMTLAAQRMDATWLDLALAAGGNPNLGMETLPQSAAWTPIFYAVIGRSQDCIRSLARAGADLEVVDSGRRTPLALALERRHFEIVHVLLEMGANAQCQTIDGRTAIDFIRRRNTDWDRSSPIWTPEELAWFDKTIALLESRGIDMTPPVNYPARPR